MKVEEKRIGGRDGNEERIFYHVPTGQSALIAHRGIPRRLVVAAIICIVCITRHDLCRRRFRRGVKAIAVEVDKSNQGDAFEEKHFLWLVDGVKTGGEKAERTD